jgi:hypothetical protein
MHNDFISKLSTFVIAMSLFPVVAASPAAARIECRGNFQITKHGPISTPYCEERQIARVARSYGFAVTDPQEVWLCQVIGNDVRLKGSCAGYSEPRGFPW